MAYQHVSLEDALAFYKIQRWDYEDRLNAQSISARKRRLLWYRKANYLQIPLLLLMMGGITLNLIGYTPMRIDGPLFIPILLLLMSVEMILSNVAASKDARFLREREEEIKLAEVNKWVKFLGAELNNEIFRKTIEWLVNNHSFFEERYNEYLWKAFTSSKAHRV